MLTIIGLGLSEGDLTLNAINAIYNADKIYVKTALTSTYNYFKKNNIEALSFDIIYESATNFTDLDNKIIDILIENSKTNNIVFCVNGNGSDDTTVIALKNLININIISGVGHMDAGLKDSVDTSSSIYSAYDIVNAPAFFPDKRHTVIIKEIDNQFLASEVKLILQNVYGDEYKIKLLSLDKKIDIAISELDRIKDFDYSTTCVVPPINFLKAKRYDLSDLIEIMEHLLGENGCPWDKAQTHKSIRINLIEEAYELVDAINNDDIDNMVEETGDVLLQSVFHSMLGKAGGEYNISDVLTELCNKLITRHTHIFGENKATNAEEALKSWDNAKNVEKSFTSYTDKMEKLPKNLPALLYAYKMQKIAVKSGFDWEDINGTYDKLQEEIKELQSATGDDITKEAGDVLFSAINPLRWLHVDPELALRGTCEKFLNRFRYMETKINENNEDLSDMETREKYWNESKKYFK